MLFVNPRARRTPYPGDLRDLLNNARTLENRQALANWPRLSPRATPLRAMPGLARRLGIGQVWIKDESCRSTLGSFKALGAPIALVRQVLRRHPGLDLAALFAGRYAQTLANFAVISATGGNHGRGLAAAAHDIGCPCVIVLHARVSVEREQAIAAYGARIVRVAGDYEDSVAEAARLAALNGWQVVSDTSYEGYVDIPRDVMQGYCIVGQELVEQGQGACGPAPFTHVFVPGGVGGLAAGLVSHFWEHDGPGRPCFVVVEPREADCLFQSAVHGAPSPAAGSLSTMMSGLACGEVSPLAWRFLEHGVDAFVRISEDEAVEAMRRLAHGADGDIPIVSGESGAAALAGLCALAREPARARSIGLDATSKVVVISTEGATSPLIYAERVGEAVGAVLARQDAWRASGPGHGQGGAAVAADVAQDVP